MFYIEITRPGMDPYALTKTNGSPLSYDSMAYAEHALRLLTRHGRYPGATYAIRPNGFTKPPEVCEAAFVMSDGTVENGTVLRLQGPTTGPGEMSYRALATLPVGAVLRSTDVLETYPTYWIEPGARFVVVNNSLNEMMPMMALRLVPDDKHLMKTGDLREWRDCLVFQGPEGDGFVDIYQGDAVWDNATRPLVRDDKALPIGERIAAVFAENLANEIGDAAMADVIARNKKIGDDTCASHNFCDANMVMLPAWEGVVGHSFLPFGTDEEVKEVDCLLWNRAWHLAKVKYFVDTAPRSDDIMDLTEETVDVTPIEEPSQLASGMFQLLLDEANRRGNQPALEALDVARKAWGL